MFKPTLFMLIGLPGSGKSYHAKQLAEIYDAKVFSSDEIRKELFNDINNQKNNDIVFKTLHKRIAEYLNKGNNAIYDATNISYKKRIEYLKSLSKITCEKVAIFMATPYEICLENNKKRNRQVPDNVIKRMYKNFTPPYWYEGWDDILIKYYEGSKNFYGLPEDFLQFYKDFDQKNSHHNRSLGDHMLNCYELLDDFGSPILRLAGMLHDCGKPFCKTFINTKGEITEEAHYYQHEHVGAYNSFFFDVHSDNVERHLRIAALINWHMRPYTAWKSSQKCEEKEKKLLGKDFFDDVQYLHWADKNAH